MDVHEYRKFLSKIFPSKHLSKKIQAGEKLKAVIQPDSSEEEEEWETESEEEEEVPKKKKTNKNKIDFDLKLKL
jgi:hypothetical protein